ncbi:hypothetical protein CEQ90_15145 [Lewinellaceae bacterium SD302]|nr:hypothetical protein CEQ90_15145 [Lewinellaceae bacterium SD302]
MKPSYTKLLFSLFSFFLFSSLVAQVKGISYTISPGANYTWFNNRAGLSEAFMVGGRLGIGFGEYVELRGLYYQTIGGDLDLGGFDIDVDDFDDTSVDLARYGAELKLNIGRGKLLPYLLLGGGVQDVGRNGLDDAQNIYGTGGLGLTLAATDRFVFSVEGQYLAYRFNAVRNLLNEAERDLNGLDLEDFNADDLGNFTVGANVAFYLGGRKPGTLSEIDQAYLNAFGNGIRGLRIPFELDVAHVDFDNSLAYDDAWFAGLRAGIDFGPYIGLRAFYMLGMDDNSFNFKFDDLAMYGLDVRLNLSRAGTGFTPFAILGGGRINVQDGYEGRDDRTANSQGFASGGLGLSFPLAKTLRINGAYKILLTSQEELGEISSTDQLTSSNVFSVGLNLSFGKSAKPDNLVENMIQDSIDYQAERMRAERKENMRMMRARYESQIADLEIELNQALEAQDEVTANNARQRRDQARAILLELDEQEAWANRYEQRFENLGDYQMLARPGATGRGSNDTGLTMNGMSSARPNNYAGVRSPQPYQSEQPTMELTFEQILELVRAANPQQGAQNVYYGYPPATESDTEPQNTSVIAPRKLPPSNRSSAPFTAADQRDFNDLRSDLEAMRQRELDFGNTAEADRYQRLIDRTYQMETYLQSAPAQLTEEKESIFMGTDNNGLPLRELPEYNIPKVDSSGTTNSQPESQSDPAVIRRINGFDYDAELPELLPETEIKSDTIKMQPEKVDNKTIRKEKKMKARRSAPKSSLDKDGKAPYVPYEKDGGGK